MTIKTFPLGGAVYMSEKALEKAKTHACETDARGFPVRVLCGRAALESILDDLTQATDEAPTCKTCAARARKL